MNRTKRIALVSVALLLAAVLSSGTVLTQEPDDLVAICIVQNGVGHEVMVSQQAADTLCAQQIATFGACGGGL